MASFDELCKAPVSVLPDERYLQLLSNLRALDDLTNSPATYGGSGEYFKLISWLIPILQPTVEVLPPERVLEDDDVSPPPALALFQQVAVLALKILERVLGGSLDNTRELLPDIAVAVVSHTDESDSWTTPESRTLAQKILSNHKELLTTSQILQEYILKGIVKPQFLASGLSTAQHQITSDGRKALRPSTQKAPALGISAPPWRHERPETIALLHWTIRTLNTSQIEPSWHLIIPPILTLLDDHYSPSKTRGCNALTTLLVRLDEQKITRGGQSLLSRTGLGPVFWDAVTPCLLSLPPLTPPSHSIPLLSAAYPTLIMLSKSMTTGKPTQKDRAKLLDKLIRDGILRGMQFGGENVHVATILMVSLSLIVSEMGIWAARHLKEVVPMLSDVLSSPFGATYIPLLAAAAEALKRVLTVCWARISPWVAEVLKGVCVCWNKIGQEEEEKGAVFGKREDVIRIKMVLREVVMVLRVAGKADEGDVQLKELEREIIDVDKRLGGLFSV